MKKIFSILMLSLMITTFAQNAEWTGTKTFKPTLKFIGLPVNNANTKFMTLDATGKPCTSDAPVSVPTLTQVLTAGNTAPNKIDLTANVYGGLTNRLTLKGDQIICDFKSTDYLNHNLTIDSGGYEQSFTGTDGKFHFTRIHGDYVMCEYSLLTDHRRMDLNTNGLKFMYNNSFDFYENVIKIENDYVDNLTVDMYGNTMINGTVSLKKVANSTTYENNAAALAAGQVKGYVYRTSIGQLMIVY